jgi:hypothetical protein
MLINDGRILKNGDSVFKAQIVDSYLRLNSLYSNSMSFTLTGMTPSNPVNFYYQTPAGTQKYRFYYDGLQNQGLQATNESSYKNFYFSGNLDAITKIQPYNNYIYYGYSYAGDLLKFMNQFPNLNSVILNYNGNNYYNYTTFNKDITNGVFPKNLRTFRIADNTLSGDINTITNLNNVEDLELVNTHFTGNLGNGFTKLTRLVLSYLYSYLTGSLNDIITNSPNLIYSYIQECYGITGDATTLDVSKLKYIYWYLFNSNGITGNVSGWTFNTGLTSFDLYSNQYLRGDVSNWDISNTHLSNFLLYGNQNNFPASSNFSGSLSGWTLPSTLQNFQIYFSTGITSIPMNYSGLTYFSSLTMYALNNLDMSINDFVFNEKMQSINFLNYYGRSKLHGTLSTFVIPLSASSITIRNTYVTGNIELLVLPPKLQYLSLDTNFLTGDVSGMTIPNTLYQLGVNSNSGVTFTLSSTPYYSGKTAGVFHTQSINQFDVSYIGGIFGDLSNFIIDNQMSNLTLYSNNNFYSDLSKLNISKVYNFNATNCPNLHGDLTNWLTGTSTIYQIVLSNCSLLSGSTSAWNVNNVDLRIDGTNLGGQLKMTNPYQVFANGTKITSNIATDFNFTNRTYSADFNGCIYMTGNLSGVTLNYSQYAFYINGCTGITGSNSFINYLFINRKNFTNYSLNIQITNIGDTVTGGTQQLGDTGTFPLGTGTTGQWNLSESQVNFLVQGLDYTGTGTNTPWTQGQKVYWMQNAKISSINNNQRYIYYNISY